MQDDLERAQHYQELVERTREIAKLEPDETWRSQLLDLAAQYERLVDKIVTKREVK